MTSVLNLNVGVLGHVDSGKTSLAKALSTTASTACFDKNPQSRERGITIDLGFSSFQLDMPEYLKDKTKCEKLQFTLVDCPGHASLIRTIIGGSQIIDMFILVLDITKGMQTQTAECLVIGEITCSKITVVLNKIDLLNPDKRQVTIDKMTKKIKATLQNTSFKEPEVVAIAANPGGQEEGSPKPEGIEELLLSLSKSAFVPDRNASAPFVFAIDHCFAIKGQGTVMTGTVLQGKITVNDTVEIPALKENRKVKSMQMFRQPVQSVIQGDRVGICVTQFDPKLLERGLAGAPGYMPTIYAAIATVSKIRFFPSTISTKGKFHVSLGHETLLARVSFFRGPEPFDMANEHQYEDQLEENTSFGHFFVLLEFERPVTVVPNCLAIGSKLDMDVHTSTCRLAFWGNLLVTFQDKNYLASDLPSLKIFKYKLKSGVIERAPNQSSIIVKNLFKKETNLQLFTGMKVTLSTGEEGVIEGGFGQSGKVKINIAGGLKDETFQILSAKKEKGDATRKPIEVHLRFKKYIYDRQKKMIQE